MRRAAPALLAVLFAGLPGAASATDITVNTTSDPAPGTGTSCSLREAITAAMKNTGFGGCPGGANGGGADRILLGTGTFAFQQTATGDDANNSGDFDVFDAGIAGGAPSGPLTILGQGASSTKIDAGGFDRVFHVGGNLTLERLMVTGGLAPPGGTGPPSGGGAFGGAGGDGAGGGGIRNVFGTLTLSNVSIFDNTSGFGGFGGNGTGATGTSSNLDGGSGFGGPGGLGGDGGGIYNDTGGTVKVQNSTIAANHTGDGGKGGDATGGGGLAASGGVGAGGNGGDAFAASGGSGGEGGGIYNVGKLAVKNSVIRENGTGRGGAGGAAVAGNGGGGSPAGTGGDSQGGDAGDGGDGGGVAGGGEMTLSESTVARNRTEDGGVGGDATKGTPGTTSTIAGGGGRGGNGGGLSGRANPRTLLNVTITGNRTGDGRSAGTFHGSAGGIPPGGAGGSGGGIWNDSNQLTLTHVTIADNAVGVGANSGGTPAGTGPAVLTDPSGATTTVRNTILTNACFGPSTDGGHNLRFQATGCPGTTGDPKLGPLQDNGGPIPTPTMALGAGSAAIDKVPASGANCPSTDQRGVNRPFNGLCDIGAFEVGPPPVTGTGAAGGTVGTAAGSVDKNAPAVGGAAADPSVFAVASTPTPVNLTRTVAKGTTFRFTLSEPGTVTLTIEKGTAGLKLRRAKQRKASCVAASRRNRRRVLKQLARKLGRRAAGPLGRRRLARALRKARCKRYVKSGALTRKGVAGLNRVPFSGRIGTRALRPGRYRLSVTATDAAGNRSKPALASFRIVALKRKRR